MPVTVSILDNNYNSNNYYYFYYYYYYYYFRVLHSASETLRCRIELITTIIWLGV